MKNTKLFLLSFLFSAINFLQINSAEQPARNFTSSIASAATNIASTAFNPEVRRPIAIGLGATWAEWDYVKSHPFKTTGYWLGGLIGLGMLNDAGALKPLNQLAFKLRVNVPSEILCLGLGVWLGYVHKSNKSQPLVRVDVRP